MRHTALTRVAFPLLAVGLALHSLVITVLYGLMGLPADLVRTIAGWRDLFLVMLLSIVALRAFAGRGPKVTVAWTDLWIGGLFTLGLIYLAGENLWLQANLPLKTELMGLRQSLFFMLIYFVGRATPELGDDDAAMRTLFRLVFITAVLGILEWFFLPPEGLVALGVAAYFQDFLGASVMTAGNEYGLPQNYWAVLGGHQVRRAGSVYLGGQGFAVPFLLFFPLATTWVLGRIKRSGWEIIGYAVICLAFLLTLTRMTIFVGILQLILFLLWRRKPEWTVAALSLSGAIFLIALVFLPGFPAFVWYTLSGQEVSTAGHVNDWWNGAVAFLEQPWGFGLGTADATAARAGLEHITGDNLYLTYAVELGLPGVLLLVMALASIGWHGLNVAKNSATDRQRRTGVTIWLATVGMMINGLTAVVFNSIVLGWIFFWIAGAIVTLSQRTLKERAEISELQLTPVA